MFHLRRGAGGALKGDISIELARGHFHQVATPALAGWSSGRGSKNRFNGFHALLKPLKQLQTLSHSISTQLKQGVNESFQRFVSYPGLGNIRAKASSADHPVRRNIRSS
jgi:hypothetical protein